MGHTVNAHTAIQIYLHTVDEPEHTIIDKYNGMHFVEFVKIFDNMNVLYPYKDDKTLFLIEIQEKDHVITFEMIDDICVNGYIFKND